MAENTENTLSAYLGPEFQQRLMWQLLVEPEFSERIIPDLAIEYFDDPNFKRLFVMMVEYFKEFEKVPNLQNQSIHQAINKYKAPNNVIEEETLFSVLHRIEMWNERVINKEMLHDGDVVQKTTYSFIKQQEYRKLGEFILAKTKTGEIKSKYVLAEIEAKINLIAHIGDEEDNGTEVIEGIDRALRKEFRQTIPTGIHVIDMLTGGGLGKGEIGIILTPSGVGKTTALTKICNTAYDEEKNVLQIVFEDTREQIQRKHFSIWSKTPLSEMDDNNKYVKKVVYEKADKMRGKGHLIIKEFSQEDTTMLDIRNWVIKYQKKWGFKFDIIVLDYLDCLESHKRTRDQNEAELVIVKSFEAMASDFNIPCWTAIQSNRSGFDSELVEAHQSGGSIKRIQKAHFFMSVAKTPDQKVSNLANIRIIKARFAADGQTFRDAYFNNDTMEIRIEDDRYPIKHTLKKHGEEDIEKLEAKLGGLRLKDDETTEESIENKSTDIEYHKKLSSYIDKHEGEILKKINDEGINEGTTEGTTEGANDAASDAVNDAASDAVKPVVQFEKEYKTKEQLDASDPPNDDIGPNMGFSEVAQGEIVKTLTGQPPSESPPKEKPSYVVPNEKDGGVIPVYTVKESSTTSKVEAGPVEYTVKEKPPDNRSLAEIENSFDDPDEMDIMDNDITKSLAKLYESQVNIQRE